MKKCFIEKEKCENTRLFTKRDIAMFGHILYKNSFLWKEGIHLVKISLLIPNATRTTLGDDYVRFICDSLGECSVERMRKIGDNYASVPITNISFLRTIGKCLPGIDLYKIGDRILFGKEKKELSKYVENDRSEKSFAMYKVNNNYDYERD